MLIVQVPKMNPTKNTTEEYLFRLNGRVTFGKKLGRTVNMPTANILPYEDISYIPTGVYAATITIEDVIHQGILHIGNRPSIDNEKNVTLEVYIFNFNRDIYGYEVTITAYLHIRNTIAFDSLSQVKEQVDKDIIIAEDFFLGTNL